MTDFLEGVTPQPYGGARDEIEELRDELALALRLKRDYQEREAAAVDEAASLRAKVEYWRDGEHKISAAYVRLRSILGAMDPPHPVEPGTLWAYVESKAKSLRYQLTDMERERDVSRGNAATHMESARDLAAQLEAAQADADALRASVAKVIVWQNNTPTTGYLHDNGASRDALRAMRATFDASIYKARGTK